MFEKFCVSEMRTEMEALAATLPSTDTNEKLKKFIVSSRDDMWKDQGFILIVNAYLESNKKAPEFFLSIHTCIVWARETSLMISYVIKLYERGEVKMEEESRCSRMLKDLLWLEARGGYALGEGLVKVIRSVYEKEQGKEYMRALEEMETAVILPSKDDLLNLYEAAHTEQRMVVNRSGEQIEKLVKKLRWIRWWRMTSYIMFAIGFFTVPVLTALVMVVPIPSAVEVLVGAFLAMVGSIGKWCSYVLNKRERAAELQKDGLDTIQKGWFVLVRDIETMERLIERIFIEIEFLMLVSKYMRRGMVLEGERKDEIETTMLKSYRIFNDAEDHLCLGLCSVTRASHLLSDRLSSVTPTITPKPRSWMDIFM